MSSSPLSSKTKVTCMTCKKDCSKLFYAVGFYLYCAKCAPAAANKLRLKLKQMGILE